MAWQPIETAPKDDRDILLWIDGCYQIGFRDQCSRQFYHTTDGGYYLNEDWR